MREVAVGFEIVGSLEAIDEFSVSFPVTEC